jgi:hypothetical protein
VGTVKPANADVKDAGRDIASGIGGFLGEVKILKADFRESALH